MFVSVLCYTEVVESREKPQNRVEKVFNTEVKQKLDNASILEEQRNDLKLEIQERKIELKSLLDELESFQNYENKSELHPGMDPPQPGFAVIDISAM